MRMDNAIFWMSPEKTPNTLHIWERILDSQKWDSEHRPSKRKDFIFKLAFIRLGQQEIELNLIPIDMAIIIHDCILRSATVHGMKDMQNSDRLHIN